jgi:hypothetical protein
MAETIVITLRRPCARITKIRGRYFYCANAAARHTQKAAVATRDRALRNSLNASNLVRRRAPTNAQHHTSSSEKADGRKNAARNAVCSKAAPSWALLGTQFGRLVICGNDVTVYQQMEAHAPVH